jgi:hypothetical protein
MGIVPLLPHINAALNAVAGVLLLIGRVHIARRRIAAHRATMVAALGVSALFLVGYITYHVSAPIFVFRGHGPIRPVYYALLISHVLMAAVAIPLILVIVWPDLGRSDTPRRWRATWPGDVRIGIGRRRLSNALPDLSLRRLSSRRFARRGDGGAIAHNGSRQSALRREPRAPLTGSRGSLLLDSFSHLRRRMRECDAHAGRGHAKAAKSALLGERADDTLCRWLARASGIRIVRPGLITATHRGRRPRVGLVRLRHARAADITPERALRWATTGSASSH